MHRHRRPGWRRRRPLSDIEAMYRKSAQIVRTELLTPGFVKQCRTAPAARSRTTSMFGVGGRFPAGIRGCRYGTPCQQADGRFSARNDAIAVVVQHERYERVSGAISNGLRHWTAVALAGVGRPTPALRPVRIGANASSSVSAQ